MGQDRSEFLFVGQSLSAVLNGHGLQLDAAIAAVSPSRIDANSDEDLLKALRDEYEVSPVVLQTTSISTTTEEEQVDVSQDWNRMISDRRRPYWLQGTKVTFFVPFDGDGVLLTCTPSQYATNPPRGHVAGAEIVVGYEGVNLDSAAVKKDFERNLETIERYLQWSANDVSQFNSTLDGRIHTGLAARRAKVEHDRALASELGYRERQRTPTETSARQLPGPMGTPRSASTREADLLLRRGESKRIEFKASLRWDARTGQVNKVLEDEVLQAIAAFLNTGGGTILIGVADDATVLGIDADLATVKGRNVDGLLKRVADLVADRIGAEHASQVDVSVEDLQSKRVCVISVTPSPKPTFLRFDGRPEFFVRMGNTTRRLDARAAVEYAGRHWHS